MKKDTQITGNIGLYYTCYHLSRMGWNAMPTARNARGVDIIAYNSDCSRMIEKSGDTILISSVIIMLILKTIGMVSPDSQKDLEFCLEYDITKLSGQPNYAEIEKIFKELKNEYSQEETAAT